VHSERNCLANDNRHSVAQLFNTSCSPPTYDTEKPITFSDMIASAFPRSAERTPLLRRAERCRTTSTAISLHKHTTFPSGNTKKAFLKAGQTVVVIRSR
jgi:hypothetical protein